jgi:hypothetical protein
MKSDMGAKHPMLWKDYLATLSAKSTPAMLTSLGQRTFESKTKVPIASLQLRRRGRKHGQDRFPRITPPFLPCTPQTALAMAVPNFNNGYTYSPESQPQFGNPVGSPTTLQNGVEIQYHTHSSLVRPVPGEFSLCAAVTNNAFDENVGGAPYGLYPAEINFGAAQATEARGSIIQLFVIPEIANRRPNFVTATAVLSADHVLTSVNAFSNGESTFAGVYGQSNITLYQGLSLFGIPSASASNSIDFLVEENSTGYSSPSNFSDLDQGPISMSVRLPWDGKTDVFFVEVSIVITCLIYAQEKKNISAAEAARADLRLVEDNRTMIYWDLPGTGFLKGQELNDPSMSCPIVLDMISLCGSN